MTTGGCPFGIAVNPDGTKIYVADYYGDTVYIIDTISNNIAAAVPVGHRPLGISFTPDGTKAYVANEQSDPEVTEKTAVSVIDTATNTVTSTVNIEGGSDSFGNFICTPPTKSPILPVANFSSNVTSGYVPLSVQFYGSSQNATNVIWDFGDGTNSAEQNPMHTFSTAGNYMVNLTVSNVNGTDSKLATINVLKATPEVTWNSPTDIVSGTPLSSTQLNAVVSVPGTFTYTPSAGTILGAGTHTLHVDFTPTDTANYTTASQDVTINVLEKPVIPIANFSVSPTEGKAPLTVTFTDSSTGSPTSWSWNFGDKSISTDQNSVHTYNKQGKYTVSLTVENTAGSNTKTIKKYITVKKK